MPIHIFTYGSLMFPQVWQRVVSGTYVAQPATLHDYQRFAVRNDTYPGIVASRGSCVEGLIYRDVSTSDVSELDHFEGDAYRRIEVDAVDAEGHSVLVQTYLALHASDLSDQPWLPERFQLQRFLDTYCHDKFGG